MCRNIRTLFNFEPPATEEEIRASATQFVRKLSGYTHPSRANEAAFGRASLLLLKLSPQAAMPEFIDSVQMDEVISLV